MIYIFLRKNAANMLTFINMMLGMAAIFLLIKGDFHRSAILIILAAIVDLTDGLVARKLNITSMLGKFLDSNSDLISFGVAPGLLIYMSVLKQLGIAGILISSLYVACGAYRLAKFNAEEFNGYFKGLPITIAGFIISASIFAMPFVSVVFYALLVLILSYLMVSRISLKKFW